MHDVERVLERKHASCMELVNYAEMDSSPEYSGKTVMDTEAHSSPVTSPEGGNAGKCALLFFVDFYVSAHNFFFLGSGVSVMCLPALLCPNLPDVLTVTMVC